MAVEAAGSSDRQIVAVTWDKGIVTGEIVQMFCVNPENGDVSNSGLSANDGQATSPTRPATPGRPRSPSTTTTATPTSA